MLVVMVGIPGSGKTTWATANFHNIVSPDRIRIDEFGTVFDPDVERKVWRRARARVREHLGRGDVVCFDATSATIKRRAALARMAREAGVPAVAVWVRVPEELAWERNRARARSVPRFAFNQIANAFQPPSAEEGFDAILIVGSGDDTATAPTA